MVQAVVDEFLVDLVPDEEQVVLHGQPDDPGELFGGVDGAGRIVGRAEDDGLRPRGELGLDGLLRRQAEPVLDAEGHGDDADRGERGVAVVVRVIRLGDEDLVAGVADDGEGEVDGLRPARRHDDVVGAERNAVGREIAGHGLAELEEALGRAVAEDGLVVGAEGVEDRPRRRDVGVADVQMVDLDPLGLAASAYGLSLRMGEAWISLPRRDTFMDGPSSGDAFGTLGPIIRKSPAPTQWPGQKANPPISL